MNRDTVEGDWKNIKGKVKQRWAKLSDDDLKEIEGNLDRLEGKLQKRYGESKDWVRVQVDKFLDSI